MKDVGPTLRAERLFAARFGDRRGTRRWWVPGRIELLGKHVDYGGGRSLLTAVDRGFHVLARPRRDANINLVDGRSVQFFSGSLTSPPPPLPGRWTNYPATVMRRIVQDFPFASTGMDAVMTSDLPSSAGLSSSSALVVATFLPLAALNGLAETARWQSAIDSDEALADYLGAVENGRSFGGFAAGTGVGTMGGSQDHTAILCCREGTVSCFRFIPVARQDELVLPPEIVFAVASSGVSASKAAGVKQHYNALAATMTELVSVAGRAVGRSERSLLDLLDSSPDAFDRIHAALAGHPDAARLRARLAQFNAECREIIPGVSDALRGGDFTTVGELVDRSQRLAETVLENQVPETIHLAASAREIGAIAASAFGAGFGGSVWAMIRRDTADAFVEEWRSRYLAAFPSHGKKSEFFVSPATSGAREITVTVPVPAPDRRARDIER